MDPKKDLWEEGSRRRNKEKERVFLMMKASVQQILSKKGYDKRVYRMKITPNPKYDGKPCSYVATVCAYEDIFPGQSLPEIYPEGLDDSGYATLDAINKYIRAILSIKKKTYYKRSERITLQEFLQTNKKQCLVCVLGHFIYVNGQDYWSFFENENDKVVCVWYLKEAQ